MRIFNRLAAILNKSDKEDDSKDASILTGMDYFDSIPNYRSFTNPFVFSSTLCREQHFHLPLYQFWCEKLVEKPRFHRKQWEFVYIVQALYERNFLASGKSSIGFGVGKEPLAALFASYGVEVLATDLEFEKAQELGWVDSNQHSRNADFLNERDICKKSRFDKLVKFRAVNMNNIPIDIGKFDFCWSSCAFEHLGSIKAGIDFVLNSSRLLKPGGIAIHTTEFNLTSNHETLDNNPSFVIFRKQDIQKLTKKLEDQGFEVEPVNYDAGSDLLEKHVDLPPYKDQPHLRLLLAEKFISTSIGIIIRKPE